MFVLFLPAGSGEVVEIFHIQVWPGHALTLIATVNIFRGQTFARQCNAFVPADQRGASPH